MMSTPTTSTNTVSPKRNKRAVAVTTTAKPKAESKRLRVSAQSAALAHNLLALGSWSQEAQEARLTLFDLAVSHRGNEIAAQPAMSRLASFQHSGRVAALEASVCMLGRHLLAQWQRNSMADSSDAGLTSHVPLSLNCLHITSVVAAVTAVCCCCPPWRAQVADVGSGSGALMLLTASTDGSVSRLRLQVPTQPGSQPEAVQLRGEGEDFDGLALIPWLDCHAAAVSALCANTATGALRWMRGGRVVVCACLGFSCVT